MGSVQNDGKDPRGVRILVKTHFGQVSASRAQFALLRPNLNSILMTHYKQFMGVTLWATFNRV